jgi:hypothetical protein
LRVSIDWNNWRSVLVVVFEKSLLGSLLRKLGRSVVWGGESEDWRFPLPSLD